MAARRALEWIRTSKAQLVLRYEISDLFLMTKELWNIYLNKIWVCAPRIGIP